MAFVNRSERNFKLNLNENKIGPGEYFLSEEKEEKSKIKNNKNKNFHTKSRSNNIVPFNSYSSRNELFNKNSNPGPGTYNNELIEYKKIKKGDTIYEDFYTKKIDKNNKKVFVYQKNNFNPFTEHKGFNVSAKRFIYANNNNEEFKNKIDSNNNNQNNNINNKIKSSKLKLHTNQQVFSEKRLITIPNKNNRSHETNILILNKSNFIKNVPINSNDDNVGPGQYNIVSSWSANSIHWKSSSNDKEKKIKDLENEIKNSNSCVLTENYNNNNNYKNIFKNANSKIFIDFFKRKNEEYKINLNKQKNYEKIFSDKYNDTPGPGFYEKDFKNKINYFKHQSNVQNFGSNSPKQFNFLSKENNDIGPGEYYKKKNNFKKKKKNFIKIENNYNFNEKNPGKVGVLLSNLRNISDQNLGPGEYNISKTFIKKNYSNFHSFNSSPKIFQEKTQNENNFNENYNNNNNKENYYFKNFKPEFYFSKIKEETKNKFVPFNNMTQIIKNKNSSPDPGYYNPGIATSISYKIYSKKNPYLSYLAPFNNSELRFISSNKNIKEKSFSPFYNVSESYNKVYNSKRDYKIFGEDSNRNLNNQIDCEIPGPGKYDSRNLWNKRSFNVLFKTK